MVDFKNLHIVSLKWRFKFSERRIILLNGILYFQTGVLYFQNGGLSLFETDS